MLFLLTAPGVSRGTTERITSMTDDHQSGADPAQIIAELINADRAYRQAMYDSDFEASWARERERWQAAEQAALDAYPGAAARLED